MRIPWDVHAYDDLDAKTKAMEAAIQFGECEFCCEWCKGCTGTCPGGDSVSAMCYCEESIRD